MSNTGSVCSLSPFSAFNPCYEFFVLNFFMGIFCLFSSRFFSAYLLRLFPFSEFFYMFRFVESVSDVIDDWDWISCLCVVGSVGFEWLWLVGTVWLLFCSVCGSFWFIPTTDCYYIGTVLLCEKFCNVIILCLELVIVTFVVVLNFWLWIELPGVEWIIFCYYFWSSAWCWVNWTSWCYICYTACIDCHYFKPGFTCVIYHYKQSA